MALPKWYLLAMLACFLLPSTDSRGQWKQYDGPYGGNVQCITTYDSSIFIGLGGAVYESTDVGLNWHVRSRGLSASTIVQALTVHGSYIFASTPDGLYRSNDSGANWSIVSNSITGYYPNVLLASTAGATYSFDEAHALAYSTVDDGKHWSLLDKNLTQIAKIACSMKVGNTQYFAGDWILSTSDSNPILRIVAVPPADQHWQIYAMTHAGNELIALGVNSMTLRSTNDGKSWDHVTNNLPPSVTCVAADGNDLLAATRYGEVLRSTDTGRTWNQDFQNAPQGILNSFVSIDAKLYEGFADLGFAVSVDSGHNWSIRNYGLQGLSVKALATIGDTICAATSDGLYLSSNRGSDWNPQSILNRRESCSALLLEGTNLYVASWTELGFGLYITTDFGSNWQFALPFQGGVINVLAKAGQNLLAGGASASMGFPMDVNDYSAASWSSCFAIPAFTASPLTITAVATSNHVSIAAVSLGAYRSDDYGLHWMKCDNLGVTNTRKGLAVEACDSIFFLSTLDIVSQEHGSVLISRDGGTTWTPTKDSGITSNGYVTGLASAPHAMFASHNMNGVYVTSDTGSHWMNVSLGLSDSTVVSLTVYGDDLIACTSNSGIWHRPIKEMLSPAIVETSASASFAAYPNPASQSVRISWPGVDGNVSAHLIDDKGATVWSRDLNISDGLVLLKFDGVAPGAYHLELSSAHGVQTTSVVIQR